MNHYLVAIHYLELITAEIDLFLDDSRILYDIHLEPAAIQADCQYLKTQLDKIADKNHYIEGTIWYQPELFVVIDKTLNVIGDWLDMVHHFLKDSYQTSLLVALKDEKTNSFGILVTLYQQLEKVIAAIEAVRN